jgi:hypothetical protein
MAGQNSAGTTSGSDASFTTAACPAQAPLISGLSPSSYVISGSNQAMSINGSNFVSGAALTFHDPQGNLYYGNPTKLTFVSSSQIVYQFNDGSDAGTWAVFVTNPDGKTSNVWSFGVH